MRNRHMKIPSLEVWQPSTQDLKEIYCFDGLEQVTDQTIQHLITSGWAEWSFSSIAEVAPRCKHGHIITWYSQRRNSIMWAGTIDGEEVTYEYTKGHLVHMHVLSMLGGCPTLHQADGTERRRLC